MMTPAESQALAVDGGPKAVTAFEGKPRSKVGVEEFLSLARRIGFSNQAVSRIAGAISDDDIAPDWTLARYYGPPETAGAAFEAAAREVFGVQHAISVSSGTGALHSAYVAAGVGPGTEVIVPALGFYATAAAAIAAKGVPVFCDVDESMHMDPRCLEKLITPRTVAIAPAHVTGGVADMDPILKVARRHGLKVIEDCAQSPGSKYKGRYVGTLGDLGCFSISCYKIVGGGEGGLVITNDQRLAERTCQYAECGGLWRPDRFAAPRYPGELFNGTNYRMGELEAAVDLVQIRKLPQVAERYRIARHNILCRLKSYRQIRPQKLNEPQGEVGHTLRFYPESFELGAKIVAAMRAEGIGAGMRGPNARPDWHVYADTFQIMDQTTPTEVACPFQCPVYVQRGGKAHYHRGECPVAEDLFNRSITMPVQEWWTENDCRAVADGINKVLSAYCRQDPAGRPWM